MSFWKPKQGPWFTLGRLQHFLVGAFAVFVGGLVAGYQGLAWGLIIAFFLGAIWEMITKWLAERFRWLHPYGDVIDLIAFFLGAIFAAVAFLAGGGA